MDSLGVYQSLVSGEMAVVLECQDLLVVDRMESPHSGISAYLSRERRVRRVLMGVLVPAELMATLLQHVATTISWMVRLEASQQLGISKVRKKSSKKTMAQSLVGMRPPGLVGKRGRAAENEAAGGATLILRFVLMKKMTTVSKHLLSH